MGKLIFITGGVRSGKSRWVVERAKEEFKDKVIFVATARETDEEMKERISNHKKERPALWEVTEAPLYPQKFLTQRVNFKGGIILDCVTFWVANLMDHKEKVEQNIKEFIEISKKIAGKVYIVSNEVGMGIVPSSASGRKFRDLLGKANQLIAQESEEVYFMISGIPHKIK